MKRPLQVVVIGSAADIGNSEQNKALAFELGELIAEKAWVIGYGGEKDVSSLSTVAAEGAKSNDGIAVALTYETTKELFDTTKDYFRVPFRPDAVVPTGSGRGGGREYLIGLFGDVIIAIGGGSGTENELVAAYQNWRNCIGLMGTGGQVDFRFSQQPPGTVEELLESTRQPKEVRALFDEDGPIDFTPKFAYPWDSRRIPMLGVQTPQQAVDLAAILGPVYIRRMEDSEYEREDNAPS